MAYNLLRERWIPVRRASGTRELIAPSQIAEMQDPAARVETGRADFDNSLTQFLIGLVQTAAAPKDRRDWRAHYEKPLSPEALRAAFARFEEAFDLDGPGPRFMQDLELDEARAPAGDLKDIAALLIDIPSHFIKEGRVEALDLPSVATALFTLQTNAPAGGRGHLTSLRGGGPLTTLILGETLWKTVWLNTLLEEDALRLPGNRERGALHDIFPWMAPTRTGDRPTTPEDVHPLQCFWGMPRRIRLDFSRGEVGACSLSGRGPGRVVTRFCGRPYGVSYEGAFCHPLTPHSKEADEDPNPTKGRPFAYRDWPNYVTGRARDKKRHFPAKVVSNFYEADYARRHGELRLWAAGYQMDNMKPVCWFEAMTPLLTVDEGFRDDFRQCVVKAVAVAEEVRRTLVAEAKKAMLRRAEDARGDWGFLSARFDAQTHENFFAMIRAVRDGLEETGEVPEDALEDWLQALHEAAMSVFRDNSQENAALAAADLKRIATAHQALLRFTSPRAKKLRALLDLPEASPLAGRRAPPRFETTPEEEEP